MLDALAREKTVDAVWTPPAAYEGLRTRRNAPTDLTPLAPGRPEHDAAPRTIRRGRTKQSKS
jgi:hypothetical protein